MRQSQYAPGPTRHGRAARRASDPGHGTPGQQARFLPRIISGKDVYCQGYSEPDHGSDLAAIEAKGTVDGDEIIIHGQKLRTSRAQRANMIFILRQTDPGAPRRTRCCGGNLSSAWWRTP
jgi:alkylation response protein AidB-like acyl-CoA dehydrogenase